MSKIPQDARTIEEQIAHCYSTWGESYYNDYYGPNAAYPPVHRDLIVSLVEAHGARRVIDAGCGPASILRHIAGADRTLYGFDLTPEMICEAKRVMAPLGVEDSRLWVGSVLDQSAYRPPSQPFVPYDAALCVGVLPHLPEEKDEALITQLRDAVRPGGLVLVEARNELFSLFTMNRYSSDFFGQRLISPQLLRADAGDEAEKLDVALAGLTSMFRTDLPSVRKGHKDEPGYDEVLSRLHNPIVLARQFAAAGFAEVRTLFYHFHCMPPMIGSQVPKLFLKNSLAMEKNPEDWRGHFMASAFIIAAIRQ
jgi:SAM-dependent methyltransferase